MRLRRVDQDHLVWRLITPFSNSRSFRSSFASGTYGQTCADESRKPHRTDITGDDETVGLTIYDTVLDGGVQGVRVAVLEQPGEFGIGDVFLYRSDGCFD